MTNELDIRKVPVSELQTRAGEEVLFVAEDLSESGRYPYSRVVVVVRLGDGAVFLHRVGVDGRGAYSDIDVPDIIRKKQLKGRVLYIGVDGKHYITDYCYTKENFTTFFTLEKFIRILTEVPELPTEEV
jgi:hypothetical protein